RTVERLDRLHDRRLRQSSREDRADKLEPRHRCHHVDGYDAVFDSLLAGFIVHDLSTRLTRRRQSAQLPTTRTAQPIFAWANVTFKQATVLKAFVASGTFLPSLFRERARVPSKANASKPPGPSKTSI